MLKFRHSLALLTCGMLACSSDSLRETAVAGNDIGTLSRAAAHSRDDTSPNAVDWTTPTVDLHADDFRIAVSGETFRGQTQDASLHSDPGTPNAYTTFERVWHENGVEMRLFIYFYADASDWWASEIRIYDGRQQADWLAATGEWFRRPLGQAFTGDLDLTLDVPSWIAAPSSNHGPGRLTLHGLQLQAFTDP